MKADVLDFESLVTAPLAAIRQEMDRRGLNLALILPSMEVVYREERKPAGQPMPEWLNDGVEWLDTFHFVRDRISIVYQRSGPRSVQFRVARTPRGTVFHSRGNTSFHGPTSESWRPEAKAAIQLELEDSAKDAFARIYHSEETRAERWERWERDAALIFPGTLPDALEGLVPEGATLTRFENSGSRMVPFASPEAKEDLLALYPEEHPRVEEEEFLISLGLPGSVDWRSVTFKDGAKARLFELLHDPRVTRLLKR